MNSATHQNGMTTTIHRRKNLAARSRNKKTLAVLALHHAGRTPREIVGLLGVSRDQIYGILNYRGLVACPDDKNESIRAIEWRNAKRERETDALCESGEVDRQALAFRIAAMGGTAQMIAVELGCELSLAEKYMDDCPPGWMTFRD